MQLGDLSSGSGRLHHTLRGLRLRWQQTAEVWKDSARAEFEERYLRTLDPQVIRAIEAINRLSHVLSKAREECS